MAPQSSGRYVSYDLRPAKQCERRIILDSLFAAREAGFEISDYRYVGMGANRFYDFMLLHKYLGTTNMISLEHDPKMVRRAEYNKPYKFIDLVSSSANDFISANDYNGNSIYWMDYDTSIQQTVVRDVASLGPKLVLGDFVFFTVCAEVPGYLQKMNGRDRLSELTDRFGDLANSLKINDVENANFVIAVHRILHAAFKSTLASRKEGRFRTFFQVEYKDGVKMFTYGGLFSTAQMSSDYLKIIKSRIPFLKQRSLTRYVIKKFDLTDKERRLFDLAATSRMNSAKEKQQMRKLGFRASDLKCYKELLRYHPRYVETLM